MTKTDLNVWGTPKADVDTESGYCADCEREGGRHYTNCPQYVMFEVIASGYVTVTE